MKTSKSDWAYQHFDSMALGLLALVGLIGIGLTTISIRCVNGWHSYSVDMPIWTPAHYSSANEIADKTFIIAHGFSSGGGVVELDFGNEYKALAESSNDNQVIATSYGVHYITRSNGFIYSSYWLLKRDDFNDFTGGPLGHAYATGMKDQKTMQVYLQYDQRAFGVAWVGILVLAITSAISLFVSLCKLIRHYAARRRKAALAT